MVGRKKIFSSDTHQCGIVNGIHTQPKCALIASLGINGTPKNKSKNKY